MTGIPCPKFAFANRITIAVLKKVATKIKSEVLEYFFE